ncbi:arylamine N-acetyltransferase, partial [Streptomyces sp. DT225]
AEAGGGGLGDLDVLSDGRPRLRLERRGRELAGFRAGAWYHRTSPDSHFTPAPVCSRCTDDGRITLSGRKLLTMVGGERHETPLGGDEVLAAYRDHFGLHPDRLPGDQDLR